MNFDMHFMKGLDVVADAFSGTVYSDIVQAAGEGVLFVLHKGVGATGTSTLTVEACSTITATATAAVPFIYRKSTGTDVWGDWAAVAATGFVTTAGSSQLYQVYVDAAELAEEGYKYVRLAAVESVDSPVLGGILIAIVGPRYQPTVESLID